MRISVFGLGYVGSVSAACLAADGHTVIGVDISPLKVDLINGGEAPIVEAELGDLVAAGRRTGRLAATCDARAAVAASELSLICVGTPSQSNGSLDLRYIRRVCAEIGAALSAATTRHVVVVRSTLLPGTMRETVVPTLEESSGRRAGTDFGVCVNPEFLREGTAIADYREPPKTVIGASDDDTARVVASLYRHVNAPLIVTSVEVAEMVKYSDNAWHALKVAFANEIGTIARSVGIDSHAVMDIFLQDRKLNVSPAYLRPGFAFGGSCLPKDVRALAYRARTLDLNLPLLDAVLPSNQSHIDRAVEMILDGGRPRVGVLGFSFKAGTDDLRESPMVAVIERLIGKGIDIRAYDRNVQLARLTGANKDFVLNHIPHIARVMSDDARAVIEHAETVVIGNRDPCFGPLVASATGRRVVDLVRVVDRPPEGIDYRGICW